MAQDGKKPIHANHRARMQQRVRDNGLESLQEHEALEYLLFFAIPRKDTNELAHRLIQYFGSFCRVLEATESELMQVEGIGPASARFLHTLLEAFRYYSLHKRDPRKPLRTFEDRVEFLRPLFMGYQEELFYMVALNDGDHPLHTILVGKGIPNKVTFDRQQLARIAVSTRCTRMLLAHNHPSGLAILSAADQQATALVAALLGPLGISIADHIVVTPTDAASLAKIGRLPVYDPALQQVIYPIKIKGGS